MQKQKSVVAPDPRLYEAIRVAYRQSLADNPSAEECPYCAGLGAVTLDVEPGHPACCCPLCGEEDIEEIPEEAWAAMDSQPEPEDPEPPEGYWDQP